jgi:transcriptional regulator with XRE-family HTH domain
MNVKGQVSEKRLPDLHARMRRRRSQLGLTGTDLARRAGISTSYVSLIETGAKIPEEDVAARLARALQDDEALYRAWARAARLGIHDLALLNELEAISRTPAYVSLVESGEELPRLEAPPEPRGAAAPAGDLATRLREVASRLGPEALAARRPRRPSGPGVVAESQPTAAVAIPVLAAGADPTASESSRSRPVADRLLLDRRLLEGHDAQQLFAYEVTPAATKHLRGVAAPGDRIVFQRRGAVTPDRICAIRTGKGIVLARALVKEGALLLLPGEGEVDFESVDLPDPARLSDVVVGTHVLLIRR